MAPQHSPGSAILGIGANLSFDYSECCFERFAARGYLPEFDLDHIERGTTPYRRPPYSFVADGFVCLGSAACITNPWSGEGVPYGWLLDRIAAEEFGRAMADGAYPTRAAVWAVNLRYIRDQGADFARNLALICGAIDVTPEENDYEFRKGILFQDDLKMPSAGSTAIGLLGGVVSRGLSFRAVTGLVSAASVSEKVFKHYANFPESPEGFDRWVGEADKLWAKARTMADLADKDLAQMDAQ
jgi:hypothetical protein